MSQDRTGQIAVIFVSTRTACDPQGYARAAAAMAALAAAQPGYCGIDHAGDAGGGITVSYWLDDAAAQAWRDHPEHRATREAGRDRWYEGYQLVVARVERGYAWRRD